MESDAVHREEKTMTGIRIYAEQSLVVEYTAEEWTRTAPVHFDISERVEGASGQAFDFMAWFEHFRAEKKEAIGPQPTHLQAEAADEFQAIVPWEQLGKAAILYAQEGKPQSASGVRLYVPDGSSECLNVKNVVCLRFRHMPEQAGEAAYGFKNVIQAEKMKFKPK
jgi:hypothetical protein